MFRKWVWLKSHTEDPSSRWVSDSKPCRHLGLEPLRLLENVELPVWVIRVLGVCRLGVKKKKNAMSLKNAWDSVLVVILSWDRFQPRLVLSWLCSQGWPWISNPPDSLSQGLGLQVCATAPFMLHWRITLTSRILGKHPIYCYTHCPSRLL